ncbi:MAG: transporter substrate-binding domain-containing protein [Deltaproteobacteria bacterium]|nr:transporter substrate-binding domain-containing protein [Deltaproteobacteria bacterium]
MKLTVEERTWLDQNPDKLTLLFNTKMPPMEFSSATGVFTGVAADIIALVEKRLGVVFTKNPSDNWHTTLAGMESGECALAPTIVSSPERERIAFFTTPYVAVPLVIIGTRALHTGMKLEDLSGRRVAVVGGSAAEDYMRSRAKDRIEIIPMPSVVQGLRATSFGQVDAVVEGLGIASHFIAQEGISNLRVIGNTDYAYELSIGVSRKYPLLFSSVQKALADIPPAELESIRNRWVSPEIRGGISPETKRLIALAAVFTALLLLGMAIISFLLKRRLNEKVANLKASQQELLEQAELLHLAMEVTQAGIWEYRMATGMIQCSGQWWAMLGYPPQVKAIAITEHLEMVHPDDRPALNRLVESFIAAGGQERFETELRLRRPDGTWCWVYSKAKTTEWDESGGPSRIIGLDVNIQTLKEVQGKMVQSEARFRTLFMNAPIPLAHSSLDGTLIAVNGNFERVLGYTCEDIRDLDHWWRLAYPDPDYRNQVMSTWQAAIDRAKANDSSVENAEYRVTCKDGTVLTMIIGANLLSDSMLISCFDITERKRAEAEREKLHEQLLQSQKLEAIGTLAGGVAHDFNNMLGAIIGYAELTLMQMDAENPSRKNLDRILDAAQRSAALTRQLLTFARKQTVTPVVMDLNESIESTLKMLRRLIGENISLIWLPGQGPCIVRMDPSQFDQILVNLCVNAKDAIAGVGRITIETDAASVDQVYCDSHAGAVPGDYVILSVSDDGCGMDKETLNRIFEPFFTTKGTGEGTGMGLATVYGIVKQSHGVINVYSEPHRGTTFKIYIPCHASEAATAKPERIEEIPRSRGETILIVEDDPTLLEMGGMMLQQLGYSVILAGTPSEAIRIAEENSSEVQLFITDVVMPEMNGRDLADRLQSIRPTMKSLFMSGYTAEVIAHQGVLEKGIKLIQKPFSLKDLAIGIRNVLDG